MPRPKKYETDADRQKAYRAKRQNLEERLSDLEQRVAEIEARVPGDNSLANIAGKHHGPAWDEMRARLRSNRDELTHSELDALGPSEGQGKGKASVSVGKSKLGQSEKLVPRRR